MTPQDAPIEAFIHYSYDFSVGRFDTLAEQEAKMREIQRYHMDNNGWSDIGYAFVVFQPYGTLRRARAFQGRPTKYVPAAQANHNTRTLPICVVAGPDNEIKRNTRYVIEQLINRYPSVKVVGGHRDVVATSCPGDKLYAQIPTIARATGRKVYKP
jgi:hypothetical protein